MLGVWTLGIDWLSAGCPQSGTHGVRLSMVGEKNTDIKDSFTSVTVLPCGWIG